MSDFEFFLPCCFCVRWRESDWEVNNVSSHGFKEKSHIVIDPALISKDAINEAFYL